MKILEYIKKLSYICMIEKLKTCFMDKLRENYCIIAIKNLIKKNNFLQLSIRLSENQITEEEFEKELDTNLGEYLIEMKNLSNQDDLRIINNLLLSIGTKFSIDEVSELFSIDLNSLNNEILTLSK